MSPSEKIRKALQEISNMRYIDGLIEAVRVQKVLEEWFAEISKHQEHLPKSTGKYAN